jgi:hypothetical protein
MTVRKKYCGSQYGYRLHRKNGTKVCEPCRLAMNAVNTRSRKANPEKEVERHRLYRENLATRKK